jgi:hypothetical protein
MARVFKDEIEGIEMIAAEHGKRIIIPKNTAHQIVADRHTGEDIGIAVFNGNRDNFEHIIYDKPRHYIFWRGSTHMVAFNAYSH